MSDPITSKGFTFYPPVEEGSPNTISWGKGEDERKVTYMVKSSMGIFQRMKMNDKLWEPIGVGDKTVFLLKADLEKLKKLQTWPEELRNLKTFFDTTFREALSIAKKVHVEIPEFGSEISEKETKKIKTLVKDRLVEMVAAARSSPKGISKLKLSGNVGVIRCETTQTGEVKLSATKGAGKGSFMTVRRMIDFGSVEKISVGNTVYAYLKLHDLKTLSPEEAQERIKDLREQIKTMNFFAAHGAVNIAQLYRVKQEVRKIGGKEEEVPVGIMVEWCTLGDAEWITLDPPRPGTKEYTTCVRIAYDIAMGLASIHADPINYVHGDIKPANFLLTSLKGKISGRIGDLGSCVKAGQKTTSLSKAYSAPEMLLGSKKHIATTQSDAWSFGVALLEMFHGQDSNEFAKISSPGKWKEALAAIKVHVNPNDPIDALILDCFQAPQRRPTLQQAADRLLAVLLKSSGESSADVGRRAPEASPTGETSKGIAGSVNIAPQKILPHVQPTKKPLSQKVQAQIEALEHQWALDWKLKATRQ